MTTRLLSSGTIGSVKYFMVSKEDSIKVEVVTPSQTHEHITSSWRSAEKWIESIARRENK